MAATIRVVRSTAYAAFAVSMLLQVSDAAGAVTTISYCKTKQGYGKLGRWGGTRSYGSAGSRTLGAREAQRFAKAFFAGRMDRFGDYR